MGVKGKDWADELMKVRQKEGDPLVCLFSRTKAGAILALPGCYAPKLCP
jgi:hypothetical protein